MRIVMKDNETIVVDFWGEKLEAARILRLEIWADFVEKAEGSHAACNADVARLGELFCTMRIDLSRVVRALEHGGNLASIPVDPLPEFALVGENRAILQEGENRKRVFEVLSKEHGITQLASYDEQGWATFRRVYEDLRNKGALLPGLRGV